MEVHPIPFTRHSDWLDDIPLSPLRGYIEGKGNLLFSTIDRRFVNFVNNVGMGRHRGFLLVAVANRDPNVPTVSFSNVDSNTRWKPTKYYLGRYTLSVGNFVYRQGTIDFPNQMIDAHFPPWTFERAVTTPFFERQINRLYEDWGSNDPLAIDKIEGIEVTGDVLIGYGLGIKFGYDLAKDVYLEYVWL